MNAVNGALTWFFDLALWPFELLGNLTALLIVSGVFGVLALIAFKHISWQKGIKSAKDRIKGHMIEIRIYQDDLVTVGQAVCKILYRNFQYVGLNFGPFIPLAIPFGFVVAQLVVRYGYDPVPITAEADVRAGRGTLIEVELKDDQRALIADLSVTLPEGLQAISPLVRAPSDGRAFQEIVALAPGTHEIVFELPGGVRETKLLVAGDEPLRSMQPLRVSSGNLLMAILYPAEPGFGADSPFATITIPYPDSSFGWLPGGEAGILIIFVLASMLVGFAALKPLGVQI
jgi:hypothetical protein